MASKEYGSPSQELVLKQILKVLKTAIGEEDEVGLISESRNPNEIEPYLTRDGIIGFKKRSQ
ncbi:MAG: hypothetical protein QW343_00335 [Candidatus Norongarragalinales archaeon]